jgi:hypothetical protein
MVQVEPGVLAEAVKGPYLSEFTFLNIKGHCFHQSGRNMIPDMWILLDSQSSSLVGTVKNFDEVWFNPESFANILLMAEVSKVCRITMDTSVENAVHVHQASGTLMKFQEYKSGLYYYGAAASAVLIIVAQTKMPIHSYTPSQATRKRTLSAKLKERTKHEIYTGNANIHLSKISTKFCRTTLCVTIQ